MSKDQWDKLVSLVNAYGPEKLEFEADDGEEYDFVEVSYMTHEDKVVVLLS